MKFLGWEGAGLLARSSILLVCGIGALGWITEPAAAQSGLGSGRIEGTVLDSSGAIVAKAEVTAQNDSTGLSATQMSVSNGYFLFPYLPPGTYHVTIEKAGFKTTKLFNVVVEVGTTVSLRPQLAVGSVDTKVEVSADAPLVDTTRSSVSSVIGQSSIENLPLNGRDFTDFVLLTPGATTDGEFGMVSFNGISGNFNNYTVDGGGQQ